MKRCLAWLAVTMLLHSITVIPAQDDALQTKPTKMPEDQKFRVKTELMEVRTVVTDRDGRIIENLEKDDFELLESDQPQEISFFSISQIENQRSKPVAVDAAAQDKTAQVKRVEERLGEPPIRTTLLYVDNLHTSFSSLNRVKEAIRRFIKERLTEQDMVAVATSGQTLGIAQQFTRDRQLLNYAIEQIRLGPLREEGTNRMGTATAWVDVPELAQNKLEMSSLIFSNPLDIDSANAEGIDVSKLEQIRMVQSIPLFAHGDFFDYSFRVYQGALAVAEPKLEWMPELFQGGQADQGRAVAADCRGKRKYRQQRMDGCLWRGRHWQIRFRRLRTAC